MVNRSSFLAAATLASVSNALVTRSTPSITWGKCPDITAPNLDCGQIKVPIDYSKPNGDSITLGMARLKANGTSRLGSLIYNPGGPGVPGSQNVIAVTQGAYLFSKDLIESYDIIGIDPRGTGASSPVACDPKTWASRVNYRPQNQSEFDALIAHNKAFGASCKAKTGALLDHLDTIHVAKDFELVRQALGEKKMNYLGQSYGTHIGTTYAELYPDKMGRFALDGVTDHTISEVNFGTAGAATLELTMNKFFQWCNTTEDCALHGMDSAGIWDNLIATAGKTPVPAPLCAETGTCRSDATAEEIIFIVKTALHSLDENPLFGPGWVGVSQAIGLAAQGNASAVSMPIPQTETDGWFSTFAIACADWTRTPSKFVELAERQQMRATLSPHVLGFSPVAILNAACIEFPIKVGNPNHALDQKKIAKIPPVLLVQSLWDPATSIEWSVNVKSQLPGSTLIIRDGVGHSSYQLGGDSAKAVDQYLIKGTMPKDGTTYKS